MKKLIFIFLIGILVSGCMLDKNKIDDNKDTIFDREELKIENINKSEENVTILLEDYKDLKTDEDIFDSLEETLTYI